MLVVIDMQRFGSPSARSPRTLDAVQSEIGRAVDAKEAVLFVEYAGVGPTHPSLTKLVDTYQATHTLEKHANDGSPEILNYLQKAGLKPPQVTFVGVNTSLCVKKTVRNFAKQVDYPCKIRVVAEACNCASEKSHRHGLQRINDLADAKKKMGRLTTIEIVQKEANAVVTEEPTAHGAAILNGSSGST